MTDTILKAEGLVKRYGSYTALMGLDLELPKGKIIGIVQRMPVGYKQKQVSE